VLGGLRRSLRGFLRRRTVIARQQEEPAGCYEHDECHQQERILPFMGGLHTLAEILARRKGRCCLGYRFLFNGCLLGFLCCLRRSLLRMILLGKPLDDCISVHLQEICIVADKALRVYFTRKLAIVAVFNALYV
jgi:hypothetical protein